MTYNIRPMTPQDWDQVRRIYLEAVEKGGSTFNTRCLPYPQWDASHCMDCRFVLEVDSQVAGWCALSPTSAIPAYWGVVEVSIYLDSPYHRHGLGSALLLHLIEKSEERGYWSLYSNILTGNTGSIRLHEKCGFRQIGYKEKPAKDRFGVWQDTLLYERRSQKIL